MEKFWDKIEKKFSSYHSAFRHFDKNYDGRISFKELRIVSEELDFRFTPEELKSLFAYIDDDNGGTIGY